MSKIVSEMRARLEKARKENLRIRYECPITANELHRYFPYEKGIVESAETQT